eukprot:34143-Eustigmatos_ZCMA.PRE.1
MLKSCKCPRRRKQAILRSLCRWYMAFVFTLSHSRDVRLSPRLPCCSSREQQGRVLEQRILMLLTQFCPSYGFQHLH